MRAPVIAAIAVVVLLAAGAIAYFAFGGDATSPVPAGADAETVNQLTQSNTALRAQVTDLTAEIEDLENNLSVFRSTTSAAVPLTIRGTVAEAAGRFTLTTSQEIVLTVANSAAADVATALRPFAGSEVEVTGTHPGGSPSLTVTHVNGISVAAAQATTTPATTSPATP